MSNENEQRFLLREIENLKQRLERLEVQEKGRFIITPSTVTDNEIPRFDGTDGKKLQNSGMIVDDSGNVSTAAGNQSACPTSTTDTGIIVADGTNGKKIKSTPAKVDASGNMELPSAASLKLKSYNVGEWASWTPTLTGWSGTYAVVARYSVVGKICFWMLYINGISNATTASATLPFKSKNVTNAYWGSANNYAVNAGTAISAASRWNISANSNVVSFYSNMATGAWTNSGDKRIYSNGWFEIA